MCAGVGGCPDTLANTCTLSGDAVPCDELVFIVGLVTVRWQIVDSGGQYGAEQAGAFDCVLSLY